ncbi:membrane protein [Bradyrhizobium sp. SSBR45G]|uniref:DUF2232 domain-containing protein n=1 Tax=unclassified Bradyrhizobium TaxID=2631580 RepID=UPI002342AFDF|nr:MULTISPECIES: DUF2232 domain-containing protein [unclassified Bradyrhizobium]GLH81578.1 membrane protein [Bradyrhizobium sp. SSBR45G]GLH89016.1 membrane protein [Bradyrhizobium sp. SSBR45R]
MIGSLLIAIAAGAASAVMFASTMSGVMMSLVLASFAPVPLMVAAIAWGRLCAAIGGLAATACVFMIFGAARGELFALAVALPAWWLGHLVLLGRPVSDPAGHAGTEWYPTDNILLWIAMLAALTVAIFLGTDMSQLEQGMRQLLPRALAQAGVSDAVDVQRLVELTVFLAPPMMTIIMTVVLSVNLAVAAKITSISGRLIRPWPRLRDTKLPLMTIPALVAIIGLCFMSEPVGLLARMTAAALLTAYALTGFAVLHTLTLLMRTRPLWLGLAYAPLLTFVWPLPMLAMTVLGLADAAFDLRHRFGPRQPPPLPVP